MQRKFDRLLVVLLFLWQAGACAALSVSGTGTELHLIFDSAQAGRKVAELAPYQEAGEAASAPLAVFEAGHRRATVARFDGARDRLYSGFVEVEGGRAVGPMRFVEVHRNISKYRDRYPRLSSKKGLQVQMTDDAIALGVKHAAFNFDFGRAIQPAPQGDDARFETDGRVFWFDRRYIEGIDREVKTMSDSGAAVTLILLNYVHAGTAANGILQHPRYDAACPQGLSAFNTGTAEGLAWYKACVEFLADRYSQTGFPHGRVVNYIVGNEVNTHWHWDNMGRVTMEEFARDYARAVRLCAMGVRKYTPAGRVYVSLEHHWNIRFAAVDERQSFPARPFLEYFNEVAKAGGDFDWNVAFHPYPEDLFNPRTWQDKSATLQEDTPRITFRNIEMLPAFLRRPEMRYRGAARHVILSEQGFHSAPTAEGEQLQAAAYCYAWRKIVNLRGIDAFILHRQVDHAGEGGLNLGLWRRNPASAQPSEPLSKKPIYEVFRRAGTPQWKEAFAFALPIIGIRSWDEMAAR